MKKIHFIAFCTLMLLYTSVKAQNLSPTETHQFLDTNDISASVNSYGILFYNDNMPGFEVPKGSGKHTIYMNNIWLVGLDGSSQLHTAAQTYASSYFDFSWGPIATDYNEVNYLAKYNSVWKVNKSTIDYHITHHNSGGYVVPASIANWPGSGNVANGEASHLAPYYDANSNNIYDPANGDYPIIRGDQAVYFMFNDDKTAHNNGGLKMGIEVHGMAYSFANPNDSALKQTVFVNYEIFNRSAVNYHNVYMGSWSDMDIGDSNDDYIGCDSLLNLFYTYNGDGIDGSGLPGHYGTNPPAQGAVWLNHSISKFMYFNREGVHFSLEPSIPIDYYNYIQGYWRDTTQLTYGEQGHGGTTPANFAYSGDPVAGIDWTEGNALNYQGDRRGVMSVGPFSLNAGGSFCVDLAYPFARDNTPSRSNLSAITVLRERTQAIQTFYNAQGYGCVMPYVGISPDKKQMNNIKLFPNPNNGMFNILTTLDLLNSEIEIYSVLGTKIYSKKITSDKTEIDLGHNKGMYLYLIKNENNIVGSGKLIVE